MKNINLILSIIAAVLIAVIDIKQVIIISAIVLGIVGMIISIEVIKKYIFKRD